MTNQKLTFTTTIFQARKNATGIQVPEPIIEQLNAGKRPPVKVTLNGYTYQNTVGVMNGEYLLSVSAEVREKAGVNAGDTVAVTLELDNQPRTVEVLADFQNALDTNTAAKAYFETLSNSSKKRLIIPMEQAKTAETRNRRIEKAIAELEQQKKI